MAFLENFIHLFTESAPWLLLGLLIAGLMKWLVPIELLQRHMGGNNLSSVIKAAFIGAPLPLCSCGVIPAAIGLRRAGASKPASISFLVSTPETGVDSISISYALLGPFFAVMRPIAAIFSAIYAGILVILTTKSERNKKVETSQVATTQAGENCCASKSGNVQLEKAQVKEQSCCDSKKTPEKKLTFAEKIRQSLSFASGKLLEDITLWLLAGLLLAAAIKTWVPTDFLTQWGDGFVAMLVMALIGVPMYICATASTPIAAGFLAVGVSPGAVLVFMLAGPATNISTMGMIRQEMGTSVLVTYIVAIFTASIGLGYLTDWLVNTFSFSVVTVASSAHQMTESLVYQVCAVLLMLLMLRIGLQKLNGFGFLRTENEK